MGQKTISVEELTLKPIGDDNDQRLTAFCVVVNDKRSPLYFTRRDAQQAAALELEASRNSE